MSRRPVLDNHFQPEYVSESQEPLDSEGAGVSFDLGQTVLTDSQFGGKRTLREFGSPSTGREDLSKLGAVGQDLSHGCRLIGIGDKLNISVLAIYVKYRFCR